MKIKLLKKNPSIRLRTSKGFALLFSVLISSLLLTIGLSIFNIALKELAISTATRQSIHAFYAADSGRECAKYWDTKNLPGFTGETRETVSIICSGESVPINVPNKATLDKINIRIPLDKTIPITNDDEGPNFYVDITKTKSTEAGVQVYKTSINSYGQDSVGGDRVQRAIEQSY